MPRLPSQRKKRTFIGVLAILLLLIAAIVLTKCRDVRGPAQLSGTTTPPVRPLPSISGVEVIRESAGKIFVRDQNTGTTAEIDLSDYTAEKVQQALAAKVAVEATVPTPTPAPRFTSMPNPTFVSAPSIPTMAPAGGGGLGVATPTKAPEVETPPKEGTALPPWLPAYPGATPIKISGTISSGRLTGSYDFTTADGPSAVSEFYEKKMGHAKMLTLANVGGSNAAGQTATLMTEDQTSQNSFSLSAAIENGKTRTSIVFEAKQP